MGFMIPLLATVGGGAIVGAATKKDQSPAVTVNPEEERLRRVKNEQQAQAEKFRQNMQGYKQNINNALRGQESQNLAENQKAIKSQFSRRGMLNSGMHEAQQQQTRTHSAVNLGKAMSSAHQSLEKSASDMESNTISTATAIQSAQQAAQQQLYSQAMARQNTQDTAIAGMAKLGMMGLLWS